VTVGDIVPFRRAVRGDLASASPDVLGEMIRAFAQQMMEAEVEVRWGAGLCFAIVATA
jgi:hypothetical protein